MSDTDKTDPHLETLFAKARGSPPELSDDLMARILMDAQTVQTAPAARHDPVFDPRQIWANLVATLGGWPAMGGLAAACAAGVWLGFSPPAALPDLVSLVMDNSTEIDLLDATQLQLALADWEG